jgi:tetratricopeptide (TPR) repeat protein
MQAEATKAARKAEKKGDDCLKTGLFNWSKDLAGAATYYDEAARTYFDNGNFTEASGIYRKLVEVNEEMKDHWAIVRNYEGMINCLKRQGVKTAAPYLSIIDKMAPKYRLEEAEMNFINMMKDLAEYFVQLEEIEEGKQVYKCLFKHLQGMNEEIGRPDAVFGFISLLLKDRQFKEAIELLQAENEVMKKLNPTTVKRTTYAIDCVLISLLIDDPIMAERFLEKYGEEIDGFYSSRDALFCEKVITAFKNKSQDEFDKVINGTIASSVFPATIISMLRKTKFKVPQAPKPTETKETPKTVAQTGPGQIEEKQVPEDLETPGQETPVKETPQPVQEDNPFF